MQELHVHLSFGQFQSEYRAFSHDVMSTILKTPKTTLYLNECHSVFGTKLLIEDTDSVSASPSGDGTDCHFTQSSKSHDGLAVCGAKAIPSFLSCFKTLSIGQTLGIEPATTSRSTVKCSTVCANPASVKTMKWRSCSLDVPNHSCWSKLGAEPFSYVTFFGPIRLHSCWPRDWKCSLYEQRECIKVILHVMLNGTIRNDEFQRNTALQYWQCCNHSKQGGNKVATICCAKIVVANRPV